MAFLPITKEEMTARGWDAPDIVVITGDAYVCLLYTSRCV